MSLDDIVKAAKSRGFSEKEIIGMLTKRGYSKDNIEDSLGIKKPTGNDKPVAYRGEINFIEKFKLLFSNPAGFFDIVREDSMGHSIGFFTAITAIVFSLRFLVFSMFSGLLRGSVIGSIFGLSIVAGIVFFVLVFALTFVFAGIVHATVKIMHGTGGFVDSYNIVAYSLVPAIIISSFLPLIGFLSFIYSIVIMVFGISTLHKLSKGKSVFAALTPFILFFILLVLLIILVILSFSSF